MLNWLIALVLLALLPLVPTVCPAAPLPAVVTAGMVLSAPPCRSVLADFDVATRFARGITRAGRAADEDREGRAEGGERGGSGAVTAAGMAMVVPDSRAARVLAASGVDSLTVM